MPLYATPYVFFLLRAGAKLISYLNIINTSVSRAKLGGPRVYTGGYLHSLRTCFRVYTFMLYHTRRNRVAPSRRAFTSRGSRDCGDKRARGAARRVSAVI